MSLLLFGAGCAAQPAIPAVDCAPDIVVQEVHKPLPAELLIAQPCPPTPRRGDVQALLDWTENCAISARLANEQIEAIRTLQD